MTNNNPDNGSAAKDIWSKRACPNCYTEDQLDYEYTSAGELVLATCKACSHRAKERDLLWWAPIKATNEDKRWAVIAPLTPLEERIATLRSSR